jgi:septum formation protein
MKESGFMHSSRTIELILASSSPRRKELLQGLNLNFKTHPSMEDESVPAGTKPKEMVEMLALRKAKSVSSHYNNGLIIGSDTIVVFEDEVLGKPQDEKDAYNMLAKLQGKQHMVFTGVAIVAASNGQSIRETIDQAGTSDNILYLGNTGQYCILSESANGNPEIMVGHTVSKVTFRPLSENEIKRYIETGEPLDKAGAYGVQGIGAVLIEKIEGDFYSVMGLPLNILYLMLQKFGIDPFEVKTK